MKERQGRSHKAFRQAVVFLDQRRLALAPELPALHKRLLATTVAVEQAFSEQAPAGGKLLQSARRQLDLVREKHMLPLARLARAAFTGEAAIQAALRVPHKRAPADEIVAASERMTKALQPHRTFLAESNIDTRRITRLREETSHVKKLLAAAGARVPKRSLATNRLPGLLREARKALDAIDGIMTASASEQDLFQWRSAIRIGKRIGRPRKRRG